MNWTTRPGRSARRATVAATLVAVMSALTTQVMPGAPIDQVSAAGPEPAKMSAYLSYTAATQGKASFRRHARFIDEISPSWWRPADAADGSVSLQQKGVTVEDPTFVAEAQAAGTDVWGVVANYHGKGVWRWDIVSKILNSDSLRAAHVRALVQLALDKGYVGIDVDYENGTRAADRAAFTMFVEELAEALHAVGKQLAVTVQPKLSEPGNQPRHRIQNWHAIGEAADEVRIMLYDYWPDNGQASQSPLPWWKAQAKFAVSQIPAHKLMLGAATYGYHWGGADAPLEDLEWRSIEDLRVRMNAVRSLDTTSRSTRFSYTKRSVRHHVWYEDAGAMVSRARVVRKYGMRGMFFWRLGGEHPRMWRAVRAELDR